MQSDPGDALPKLRKANSISSKPPKKSRKMTLDIAEVSVEDGDQAVETTSNQLVLYNPGTHDTGQDAVADTGHMVNHASSFQNFLRQTSSGRVLPSIGAFTVQCAECFKWRLIPTKEKYEEIREHILQQPFVCERAREWRPDISCEDPADISQDGSRLWAIDKPNIAQPPPGWERLLRIRGEGSTKFADVYYAAPSGKKLRSMVEVDRYLLEHPEYISQGVSRSQFSFQIPRPLQENYVRKRSARTANSSDVPALERPLEPEEVNPLSWAAPTSSEVEIAGNPIEVPPSKKRTARNPSKHLYNSPVYDQGKIKIEDGQQSRNAPTFEL